MFLNENQSLILTRADKGNVTVALDKDTYINKMEELLGDRETYKLIKKDPTRKLTTSLRDLLTRWRNSEFISKSTYRFLYNSDGVLPRAYGLPKIQKQNWPLRLIVSSLNSPLYQLASFLHRTMLKSFPKANSYISNSFDLMNRISNLCIDDDYDLISLDVISVFTNIPTEIAMDSVSSRWNYTSHNCIIPKTEFLLAVKLVLNSTFFTFNNNIYQQTFGTPTGSPLSPIIADIVLQNLENCILEKLSFTLPFYFR
ncbi:reverse transcriptase [Lasius niger]|uniref:Reverse transcriptase n=1 Tax=Lasius niger TaxID=67767 RepID=A0A0J7K0G1_LASNI|nr:reverse transcriptase [Lasius niger]